MSSIPAFTSLSEAIAYLNASGPDGNGNYTVFGLTISTNCIQSHVDHANKYIYSLVPSLQEGSTDPRLPSAELAANDLACMRVLVASVGGALVGAYDYSLADLHVSRSGPYASAIKAAIAGYHDSVIAELQNVTTVGKAVQAAMAYRVPKYHGPDLI